MRQTEYMDITMKMRLKKGLGVMVFGVILGGVFSSPLTAQEGIISLTFPYGGIHSSTKSRYFKVEKEGKSVTWHNIRKAHPEAKSKKGKSRTVYQVKKDLINRSKTKIAQTAAAN